MNMEVILQSVITCPECAHQKEETMATDSCQYFYECENCETVLKPKAGDCCVFCSYGSVKCPPIQESSRCCWSSKTFVNSWPGIQAYLRIDDNNIHSKQSLITRLLANNSNFQMKKRASEEHKVFQVFNVWLLRNSKILYNSIVVCKVYIVGY